MGDLQLLSTTLTAAIALQMLLLLLVHNIRLVFFAWAFVLSNVEHSDAVAISQVWARSLSARTVVVAVVVVGVRGCGAQTQAYRHTG